MLRAENQQNPLINLEVFPKSSLIQKIQEKDKEITRLKEQDKKWETNFDKLVERYTNLNKRLEKDKELAKQDGRNEVKWNWEKYVSKEDVVYEAEEKYGMITKEEKEELEARIKSLEEQQIESLKKQIELKSLKEDLEREKTEKNELKAKTERQQAHIEEIDQNLLGIGKKYKEAEARAREDEADKVRDELRKHIDPLDEEKVKRTARNKYGMKPPEEFAKIAKELQQLKDNKEQISELNSETKPITAEQLNIALVFLTVVSWIGLLGVLIKDEKKKKKK